MLVTTAQSQKVISGSGPPVLTAIGILHVFDLATGKHLWEVSGGREIQATFNATGTTIIATITNGATYITQPRFPPSFVTAYNAQTGTKLWQYTTDGEPSPPVVAGTLVYFTCVLSANMVSSDGSSLTALDATTGKQKWQTVNALPPVADSVVSTGPVNPPQVQQGAVFTFLLGSNDETMVTAFDALSGHLRWSVDVGHADRSAYPVGTQFPQGPESLLVTPETVYAVAGATRATTAICAGDGKTLWTFTTQQNTASLITGE
jgi:outer membrane protein assembly factor BamB